MKLSAVMNCGKIWLALAVPQFSHHPPLHEGQQGQMKHNGSMSGSFPISSGVKQECFLAPTSFSIFFSIMLCEAKEDLPDVIYIRGKMTCEMNNLVIE